MALQPQAPAGPIKYPPQGNMKQPPAAGPQGGQPPAPAGGDGAGKSDPIVDAIKTMQQTALILKEKGDARGDQIIEKLKEIAQILQGGGGAEQPQEQPSEMPGKPPMGAGPQGPRPFGQPKIA